MPARPRLGECFVLFCIPYICGSCRCAGWQQKTYPSSIGFIRYLFKIHLVSTDEATVANGIRLCKHLLGFVLQALRSAGSIRTIEEPILSALIHDLLKHVQVCSARSHVKAHVLLIIVSSALFQSFNLDISGFFFVCVCVCVCACVCARARVCACCERGVERARECMWV
jgi:hypothetical protein